ncbi:YdeI/OmpD-associated family protein [Paenibacillus sp. EKM212P]|nr:YdeI/OmpD-associated family protein [Paenibacillus sp. EKM212P]
MFDGGSRSCSGTEKHAEYTVPEELRLKFKERPDLKTAFEALPLGRQRAYLLYFSEPKQFKTCVSRVEKYTQPILEGKGLND